MYKSGMYQNLQHFAVMKRTTLIFQFFSHKVFRFCETIKTPASTSIKNISCPERDRVYSLQAHCFLLFVIYLP
jgi:hypothetical protein